MNPYHPCELTPSDWAWVQALDRDSMDHPWGEVAWQSLQHEALQPHLFFLSPPDAMALFLLSEVESMAHLLKIVVHPEQRRQGRARSMLRNAMSYFQARGYSKIYLEVASGNHAAMHLYESLGFLRIHEIRGFYSNGENAWVMIAEIA